jgi:hypothetical protein
MRVSGQKTKSIDVTRIAAGLANRLAALCEAWERIHG